MGQAREGSGWRSPEGLLVDGLLYQPNQTGQILKGRGGLHTVIMPFSFSFFQVPASDLVPRLILMRYVCASQTILQIFFYVAVVSLRIMTVQQTIASHKHGAPSPSHQSHRTFILGTPFPKP